MKEKKILWVVNMPVGSIREKLHLANSGSGSWLKAAFDAFKDELSVNLAIAFIANVVEVEKVKIDRVTYYMLPGGKLKDYNYKSLKNRGYWEYVKEDFSPDIVQIWGTEYTHSYLASMVFDVPKVIYIQGVVATIARYYSADLSFCEKMLVLTLKDILRRTTLWHAQKNFEKQAMIEKEILKLSRGVILENEWSASYCLAQNPKLNVFKSLLPICHEFSESKWELEKIRRHSIFCNSGTYPLKGLHTLLKAFAIVLREYPDSILRIPGMQNPINLSFIQRLKQNGYLKIINKIIHENQLVRNIQFLGVLTTGQMAQEMSKCNAFVLSSYIENHSSSLIESMIVGAPSISSFVGGIQEYAVNGENSLIYRAGDEVHLAYLIMKIFADDDLSCALSNRAHNNKANISRIEILSVRKDLLQVYTHLK